MDGGGNSATALVVALAKLARDGYLDLTGCDQTDIGAVHAALGAWIEARRTHIFGTKARPNRAVSLRRRADELDEMARLQDAEDPPAQPQDDVVARLC